MRDGSLPCLEITDSSKRPRVINKVVIQERRARRKYSRLLSPSLLLVVAEKEYLHLISASSGIHWTTNIINKLRTIGKWSRLQICITRPYIVRNSMAEYSLRGIASAIILSYLQRRKLLTYYSPFIVS